MFGMASTLSNMPSNVILVGMSLSWLLFAVSEVVHFFGTAYVLNRRSFRSKFIITITVFAIGTVILGFQQLWPASSRTSPPYVRLEPGRGRCVLDDPGQHLADLLAVASCRHDQPCSDPRACCTVFTKRSRSRVRMGLAAD
eukprot:TRINITY_DN59533_c0_g1_i1.p1 TRINITY_DN59533_c0_g1~~TRINITY_DN59533_c0_g1_i1.p1  ORF type:complete len:141 (+),score=6.67 TRINITY_DN59533_c0_g1_i1:324-746(+)